FTLRHPFDRRCQTSLSGFFTLGFGDPFHVLLLVAVTETLEDSLGLSILFQYRHQLGGNDQFFPLLGLWFGGRPGPSFVEPDRFFDKADQHFVLWKIRNGGDSAELPHSLVLFVSGHPAFWED